MDEETRKLRQELAMLEDEHRSLDKRIQESLNVLDAQRMKKQKLFLKDRISRLNERLYPDIIA
jgi:hypothetical protein